MLKIMKGKKWTKICDMNFKFYAKIEIVSKNNYL